MTKKKSIADKPIYKEFDRMDIIGQNGNDGEHYSNDDYNKDGIIDNKDLIGISKERDNYPVGSDEYNRLTQEITRLKKVYNLGK